MSIYIYIYIFDRVMSIFNGCCFATLNLSPPYQLGAQSHKKKKKKIDAQSIGMFPESFSKVTLMVEI